jgi:L-rhamnose mutarotase
MKKLMIFSMALMMTIGMNAQQGQGRGPGNGAGPQDKPNREMRQGEMQADPEKRAERMAKILDLDEKQTAEVKALYKNQGEEMKKMREKHRDAATDNRDANREEMIKMREKNDKDLEAIIGAEKMTKWKELRREQMQNRGNRGPANN